MPSEITVAQHETAITPMQIIDRAYQSGASIEQLTQLLALQERYEANEARKAFNVAFSAFKAETIRIVRDKENTQYTKGEKRAMYTSLENMVATVSPFLAKHGLAHRWSVPEQTPTSITVACTLTHNGGHSVSESVTGPMDESGAKNKLQQVKSSMTYLKVATFESVCGLASAFGSTNDDGNGAGASQGMELEEIERWDSLIADAPKESLKGIYAAAYSEAGKLKDTSAQKKFIATYQKRKAEL